MKTNKPQPTPTPWKMEKPEGRSVIHLVDMFYRKESDELKIATVWTEGHDAEANAVFIVRAVNAYTRHTEALGRILALCKTSSTHDPMVEVYEIVSKAMDSYDVQEAVAKAEGK